jgi:hypothetical protein
MECTRVRGWLTTMVGVLAVAAAFALSLPGIQVARADEPSGAVHRSDASEYARFLAQTGNRSSQPSEHSEQASCGAANVNCANTGRQVQAEAGRAGKRPVEVIVLNNRGYNYSSPTDPRIDRHLIERELGR